MRDDLVERVARALRDEDAHYHATTVPVDEYADAARAIIPIVMEDAASEASVKVLAWLGYWRDGIDPEAVRQLQEIAQSIRSRVSEMEGG